MKKKTRKHVSKQDKQKAIADYVSGARPAQQIANELGVHISNIYYWKTAQEEEAKGVHITELAADSTPRELAKRMALLEAELGEYQKKVAEQAIIIDLLKKLRKQGILPSESELSGLIATIKKLDQKQKRVF
jgi:transposase-like protein